MKVLVVKGLGTRLYPIDFLPLAEIKLRGPITVTNVDWVEDQAVDQWLSRVS
jgi:hypothetical protein